MRDALLGLMGERAETRNFADPYTHSGDTSLRCIPPRGLFSSISSSAMGMYAGCSSGRLMTNSAFSVESSISVIFPQVHRWHVRLYSLSGPIYEAVVVMVGGNLHIILFSAYIMRELVSRAAWRSSSIPSILISTVSVRFERNGSSSM